MQTMNFIQTNCLLFFPTSPSRFASNSSPQDGSPSPRAPSHTSHASHASHATGPRAPRDVGGRGVGCGDSWGFTRKANFTLGGANWLKWGRFVTKHELHQKFPYRDLVCRDPEGVRLAFFGSQVVTHSSLALELGVRSVRSVFST